ncbi:mobilization protein [Kitasatospora aureofaciens]|uniref:relaxase/mobilization nuclease domain-containing protein n=1 Tax=Kitasatospora aureofaciens TaxID=1894 RepID=UPI001C49571D|nr:mobilization protein [Kitasatospora aureofaciens]MBV6700299.1 mobilization protein [Kitasatospora aureofaciens]
MNPKKADGGNDTAGLLFYLYGPGRRDEHADPHMVAAWDPRMVERDPVRFPGKMTIGDLAMLLDAPVHALLGKKPLEHVYHVPVRNAPEDRVLTDEEWAEVAREMMHQAGIAPHGDDQGCRWVAVRHADDHIHIVATLARQDGRQPNLRQDIVKMQRAARGFEQRWGLRPLVSGDKTAKRWPTKGEQEKAAQQGRSQTARDELQWIVRTAAAGAVSDADFFAKLEAAGVRVKQRIAPDGRLTGYSVALPGDRDAGQRAVWFPGSKLAYDLSLPRVRERWQKPTPALTVPVAEIWQTVEVRVRLAAEHLGTGGLLQGAGDVAALGDLVVVAAMVSPTLVRGQLRRAALEFERAGRAPGQRDLDGEARELSRTSARALSDATYATGRNDVAAVLGFLVALVAAVAAAQRWHEAQEYRQQAQAAGRAGRLLREAVEVSAGAVAAREYRPRARRAGQARGAGPRSTAPANARREGARLMASVVQQAIPTYAAGVLADPAWPTLRDRLVAIEDAGDDPVQVLEAAAARRELRSADSVAEVLTWRLDGWSRTRGSVTSTPTKAAQPKSAPGGAAAKPVRGKSSSPGTTAPSGEQRKGPRAR